MVLSGATERAESYIEGLAMLAAMRLCPNVPGQYAIEAAPRGYQSIDDLIAPCGRLSEQRDHAVHRLRQVEGVSCVKPKGALYVFFALDTERFKIRDDEQLVLDFLRQEHVLLVHGTAFHWPRPDHLRLVFLPEMGEVDEAITRFSRFLDNYRQA